MDLHTRKAIFRAVYNYFEKYDAQASINWDEAAQEFLDISGQFKQVGQKNFVDDLLAVLYAQLQREHGAHTYV